MLLAGAFPPFNLYPLVFVALVPLLDALFKSTPRQAWGAGYLFGVVFSLGQLHWIAQLVEKWVGSLLLALLPWLLATFAMACYFGLFGVLAQRSYAIKRPGWIPVLWAGIEVFRTYIPVLAFPWALIATPLWQAPALIQTASVGTIFLVSLWVLSVNLGLALWLAKRTFPVKILWPVGGLAALSLVLYVVPQATKPVPVTLGQMGIDLAFEKPEQIAALVPGRVKSYESAAKAAGSHLLVLPEGITSGDTGNKFFGFRLDASTPIVFGAQRSVNAQTAYQSAIGYDGEWHHSDKTRLVIFGEFVPARDFLPFLSAFNLPGGDLSAGDTGVNAIKLKSMTVGPILCFEGLFPDISFRQALNGSELLTIMSDDDWFMNSAAPDQLRMGSIWRAVETGVPVVRVGSLGYSLAADSKGNELFEVPLGKAVAQTLLIPTRKANPWIFLLPIFPTAAFLSLLFSFVLLRTKRNSEVTN